MAAIAETTITVKLDDDDRRTLDELNQRINRLIELMERDCIRSVTENFEFSEWLEKPLPTIIPRPKE